MSPSPPNHGSSQTASPLQKAEHPADLKFFRAFFLSMLALVILAGSITGYLIKKDREHSIRLHQLQIFHAANQTEKDLFGIQHSYDTYLRTGDRSYINQLQLQNSQLVSHLNLLISLTVNEPDENARLQDIRSTLNQWMQSFQPLTQSPNISFPDSVRDARQEFENIASVKYQKLQSPSGRGDYILQSSLSIVSLIALVVLLSSIWYGFMQYRQRQQDLAVEEDGNQTIIDATSDGIITINHLGVIQFMNPAAEIMFGHDRATMLEQSISRLIPDRLFLEKVAETEQGTLTANGQRKNNDFFPLEISLSKTEQNNQKQIIFILRDITARKRTEETLRELSIGVYTTTGGEFVRSLVKRLSSALQTDYAFIAELSRKKQEKPSCTLVLAEAGSIRVLPNFQIARTLCSKALREGLCTVPEKAGEQFPEGQLIRDLQIESCVAATLLNHHGKPVGVIGVMHRSRMENLKIAESSLQIFATRAGAEIERKHFEEDLASEKERLSITLRSIGDGFITLDAEGRIVLINKVAEQLTGWSHGQAIGKPLKEVFYLLNELTRSLDEKIIKRIIETSSTVGLPSQHLLVNRDQSECIIETSVAPLRDRTNRRIGGVIIFRDITAKRRAEEERIKAEKLESLGIAAGGIAHDFNNLLTAIIGNLSIGLSGVAKGSPLADRLGSAKKASLRAQDLAQQLLTFSKGGATVRKPIAISKLIADTVHFSTRDTGVATKLELLENLWPVKADGGQVSQVISNLIINAEQAMPKGGKIEVQTENLDLQPQSARLLSLEPGRYVKITIEDNGIGIPEEYLQKVFDPYFTTKPKGNGLGLATCYSIIKNHEGIITVDSKSGIGTVFSIYLPACDNEIDNAADLTPEPAKEPCNILVLDNEESTCALVSVALTSLGCHVTATQSSTEALQIYEAALKSKNKFHAIIIDLAIPGDLGAQEIMQRLLALDPACKGIVSGATGNVLNHYREFGFSGSINKPYEIDALSRAIYDALNTPDANVISHDFKPDDESGKSSSESDADS